MTTHTQLSIRITQYIFAFLCIFLYAPFASAQFAINEGLKVDVYPKIPGAFESVSISVQSFATDLNRADISWYVNDQLVTKSIGARSFTFTTGDVGSQNNVEMFARTVEGNTIIQSFSFRPSNVDLIWEALTYTPPFYKGRALYTHGAQVKVVAIPDLRVNNTPLNPDTLIYEWQVNRKNIPSASGFGKKTYVVQKADTVNGPMNIGVTVSDRNGDLVAKKEIALTPTQGEIIFYSFDPLLKTRYETALSGTFNFNTPEVTLVASPYFFPTQSRKDPDLQYQWNLNGTLLYPQTNDLSSLAFRPPADVQGTSNLILTVSHPNSIFAQARKSLIFNFNVPSEQTLFPQ